VPVIELALEGTAGVEEATVDIDQAVVICDTDVVSPEALVTVVRDAGKFTKVVKREPA
jgi:copper chaperone CopZ